MRERVIKVRPHEEEPGGRFAIYQWADESGFAILVDENVLPEKVLDPHARRSQVISRMVMCREDMVWLRDSLNDILTVEAMQEDE